MSREMILTFVFAALFVLGVAATAARTAKDYQTPGPFDPSAQGLCDFHNGIYYPTRALLEGQSPYGNEYAKSYPVDRQIPFFSPAILVLHAPFALLPLRVAEVSFFCFSVLVMLAVARLCASVVTENADAKNLRSARMLWTAGLAALIIFSRSGHISLFTGYFTLELVLASFAAIHWGQRRPWLAAFSLVIVSAKPTYILPMGFLLLARGNFKAVLFGAVLSVVAAALPIAYVAHHEGIRITGDVDLAAGFNKVIEDVGIAQEVHMAQEDESPVLSWTRLDLLAAICKWSGNEPGQLTHLVVMFAMIASPMFLLFRRSQSSRDDGLVGGTGSLILVAGISSLYHQSYDALLLVAPLAGIFAGAKYRTNGLWSESPRLVRAVVATLLLIPLYSYFSTRMVLMKFDGFGEFGFKLATSLNGVSIAIGLVIVCWLLARDSQTESLGT
ncbi:MAG: glycosyltransferase family 87 protein [Planctomycetota bacterium]